MLKMVLKMFGGGLEDGHEMVMIESIGWTDSRATFFGSVFYAVKPF